jgi:NADPH-dependent ferric siderophore reductase
MRRVTLGGDQLAAHVAPNGMPVAAFRSEGFDDEFKLFLKHPDADEAAIPEQADGVIYWPREDPHLLFRTYTVRRWDPVAGELDIDFVNHGVGPATTWANRAQPGDRIQIAGPKASAPHPVGADWTLVAGDETALPAIGRWLEDWPDGARGQVFIEVAEAEHRQDLPAPDGVEITWLSRDGAEPGTTTLLHDAVTSAPWWDGVVFAWVAGEALSLTPIRRWLRQEKGLPREQVEVTGYWRRQEVVLAGDDGIQDLDASENVAETLHELEEVLPGVAIRVAATIGLPPALGSGTRTAAELAAATGADPTGVGKLLRYLDAIGVVEESDDGYRLTTMGALLEEEGRAERLSLDGLTGRSELAGWLTLLAAVRTGAGDAERWFGATLRDRIDADEALAREKVDREADMATYVAGAVAGELALTGSVAVVGPAAGAFAAEITRADKEARATVVAAPSEIEHMRALHPATDRVEYAPGSPLGPHATGERDAVLLTGGLETYPDADAAHAIAQAAGALRAGGRLHVFAELLDLADADEHELEEDLMNFANHSGGSRTHEEFLALFDRAGVPAPTRSTIGWGFTLYTVAP